MSFLNLWNTSTEIDTILKLQQNLKLLYILNLLDLFFTKILLYFGDGLFMEANVFLNPIIDSIIPYILKIGLFALVLVYWYKRSFSSTASQLKRSVTLSKICIYCYLVINLMHISYVFLLIYLSR